MLSVYKRYSFILSSSIVAGLILACILLSINWEFFVTYWKSPVVAGWDGSSHAAIGEYYADHIFPKTWGWVPNWFAGMPFPQFYPPLFYFLVALLYKILPFTYIQVFKGVLISLTLILPGIIYFITKSHAKSILAGYISGITTVFFLSSFSQHYFRHFGISIESTFNDGMVTQLLGFIVFILWIHFFLRSDNSKLYKHLSIIFLLFVFLSNVHIVPISALVFIIVLIIRFFYKYKDGTSGLRLIRYLFSYFLLGAIPLLLASFWYLPLLSVYLFSTSKSLPIANSLSVISPLLPILVVTFLAVIISLIKKDHNIFILSISCLLIISTAFSRVEVFIPWLPFHTDRWVGSFVYMTPIVIGYAAAIIFNHIKKYKYRGLFIFIFIFILFQYSFSTPGNYNGYYFDENKDQLSEQTSAVSGDDKSLSIVESTFPNAQPTFYILNSILGSAGLNMSYIVFRESSISSIFMAPLRNSFSRIGECWNSPSTLCWDNDLMTQSIKKKLERAEFIGVNYFWVRSRQVKDELDSSSSYKIDTIGDWNIYQAQEGGVPRAASLSYEPALLFMPTDFKTSDVSKNQYNYIRFNEEAFFRNAFNVLFASPLDHSLDTTPDIERFKIAIISDYKYKNIDKAFERLAEYSKNNQLILIENEDYLFKKLSQIKSPKIKIFPRQDWSYGVEPLRTDAVAIFKYLERIKIPISEKAHLIYVDKVEDQDIIFKEEVKREVPVLIKTSYFPWWTRDDKSPIYLVTPTYMLTFAQDSFSIKFKTSKSVYWGIGVSLATMLVLIIFRRKIFLS